MGSDAERTLLCLSLTAYAGMHGEPARRAAALHQTLDGWITGQPRTRDHEIIWGPASFRVWWQSSAPALIVFVTRSSDADDCFVIIRGGAPVSAWDHDLERFGCLDQEPWLWARGPGNLAPAVCGGMRRQLDVVRELTPEEQLPGAGRTLTEFLCARLDALDGDRKLPVHVGGHGLGGALASLVALWLRDTQGPVPSRDVEWDPKQRAKLHCTAFAGPTVGNGDFASYIGDRLGSQLELIHNSLDHAPALWDTQMLTGIADLYHPHVQDPSALRVMLEALSNEIERRGLEYEQPQARILDGQLNTSLPPTFSAQAEYQHLHAYAELLGLGADLDVDAILDRPSGTDGGPVAQ